MAVPSDVGAPGQVRGEIGAPRPGRRVDDGPAAGRGARQRGGIEQVAGHDLDAGCTVCPLPSQPAGGVGTPREAAHRVTVASQALGEVAGDEAGDAGDKNHGSTCRLQRIMLTYLCRECIGTEV